MEKKKNVVVVGGGAAGLMAAITAAENNAVTVIEKNKRPARKILITGKGRCNVTNNCDNDTLIANMTKNGRFMYSAFAAFSAADTMRFFEENGVPLKTERGNRVFPVSDKAVSIADALVNAAQKKGVKLKNGRVEEILTENGRACGVLLEGGETVAADAVILATGGKSYPATGSTGDGYAIAEKLGHTVTEIMPSLVPVKIEEGLCVKLMGLSLKNVTLSVYEEGKKKPVYEELGEMLFTHFGVSGPLVLSASAHMRKKDVKYTMQIDLKPALDTDKLEKRIMRDFEENSNKNFSNSLDKLLPQKLIPVMVNLSGIPGDTKVNQITRQQRLRLCELLKGFKLTVAGFCDIEEAIVTSGGISVKEINPATMESKIIKGLYFAGELIDVDAYTGGFNLQAAFSSGALAGGSVK
ncbi:MAG: NAD(P)/FAD-dependent oxidoreductase [Clostridiales bacterium]|nr:NAD(P)/FAD-dependent oxidoreductase [Candidatus Equinaster intestinalis]